MKTSDFVINTFGFLMMIGMTILTIDHTMCSSNFEYEVETVTK